MVKLVHKLVVMTNPIEADVTDTIHDNDLFTCKNEKEFEEIKTILYQEMNKRHPSTFRDIYLNPV